MKPSHFTTPRTQAETTYWMGGDPIDRPTRRRVGIGRWIAFSAFALLCLSLIAGRS